MTPLDTRWAKVQASVDNGRMRRVIVYLHRLPDPTPLSRPAVG
jgi:hypothetical protein